MKINKYLYISVVLFIAISSCKKVDSYLDKAQTGGLTEDQVFSTYAQTKGVLANIYGGLTSGGRDDWAPNYDFSFANACDEAIGAYTFESSAHQLVIGNLSPSANNVDIWADTYAYLRKCNIFLSRIDGVPGNNANELKELARFKGEVLVLRAWYNFELFKRYGQFPIITKVLNINDDLQLPKNSEKEIVDFIIKDCDDAMSILPRTYGNENIGRVTQGVALNIKARALLYLASPLFNPSNDQTRWANAAAASKAVMGLGYTLAPFTEYAGMFHSFYDSPEVIYQSSVNNTDWIQNQFPPSLSGWASIQPSQNLVDAFEMSNGLPISDPASGYSQNDPYKNRDPRFNLNIIYNGREWSGVPSETYTGGKDGINGGNGYTQTGYYLGAKMTDSTALVTPNYLPRNHYFINMRYAEVLLNYAEAQNEVLSSPDQSVYDAVNKIRNRVGMPNLPTGLSKAAMRDRIWNERRVELAFENQRYFDVRRWKVAGAASSNTIYGMRITKTGSKLNYNKFVVQQRNYKDAYNLFPIPQSEINRDKALVQNPGY